MKRLSIVILIISVLDIYPAAAPTITGSATEL